MSKIKLVLSRFDWTVLVSFFLSIVFALIYVIYRNWLLVEKANVLVFCSVVMLGVAIFCFCIEFFLCVYHPEQQTRSLSADVAIRHFKDEQPKEGDFFCFVCPIEKDRWLVGWRDWYDYRVELGESYSHNDERLTYWFPLPKVPSDLNG